MKIAIATSGNVPSMQANSINMIRHADAFKNLGHDVTFFSVLRKNEKVFLKGLDIFSHYNISEIDIIFKKDKSLHYYNNNPLLVKIIFFIEKIFSYRFSGKSIAEKEISKAIKDENNEFCYSRSYFVAIHNIKMGVSTVLETHSPTPEKIKELNELVKISDSPHFKGIVTIHEKIKEKLIQLGFSPKKILVIEDAVPSNYINQAKQYLNTPAKPKEKKIVTYIGSLKPGKGISKIVEISKKLIHRDDIIFQILGGSQKEITAIKMKLNPGGNVFFKGFVSGNEVPRYLQNSDLLLLLYDINESKPVMDYETTSPIKLFEYMSAGKPILATKLPTITKIVQNRNKILIFEEEPVSDQIIKILFDKKYIEYGKNALNYAEYFTYEKRVQSILEKFVN